MDQSDIKAFLAVVQYGSFTKAAENIFISQSTLSQKINKIEEEIGVKLIDRQQGVRSIVLNEAGYKFLRIAKQLQNIYNEIYQISQETIYPKLRMAAVNSLTTCFSDMHLYFRRSLPQPIRLIIKSLPSREIHQLIIADEIDVGFVTNIYHSQHISYMPLFKERMVLISTQNYHKTISPVQLDPSQEIYLDWGREFQMWHEYWFGINTNPIVVTDSIQVLRTTLQNEKSWACVPATIADMLIANSNIHVTNLIDGAPNRITYILTQETDHSEQVEIFKKYFRDVLSNLKIVDLLF